LSRDLNDLHPTIRSAAKTMMEKLANEGIEAKIIQTWRPLEEQAKKYRSTRTLQEILNKAESFILAGYGNLAEILVNVGSQPRPSWLKHGHLTMAACGESKHHKMKFKEAEEPKAYAFDIACFENGKYITDGNDPSYQRAGEIGTALGLEWLGAEASRFKESAHFQQAGLPPLKERIGYVIA